MSQRGRSARTRPQRLARRRAAIQGFDRGGNKRSWLRSRWVLGTFGVVAAAALIAGLVATGFDSGGVAPTTDPPPVRRTGSDVVTGAVEGKPTWPVPPVFSLTEGVDYGAEIILESGEVIVIDLLESEAPQHVNNFVFLVNQGFYDDLTFHEVVPGVRVRAGDPSADGSGGAGYALPDEEVADGGESALAVKSSGTIAMWRDEDGASSSQFYIVLADQDAAEGATAFGSVTSGMDQLFAFDSRDPSAVPAPVSGPKILTIQITENGVVAGLEGQAGPTDGQTEAVQRSWEAAPAFALEDGVDYRATIEMVDGGVIEIDLFEELAPQHVNSFVFLSRAGFYDTLTFHRIIHGFMAQGGDPDGTGTGGPGYSLPAEFNDTQHVRGILSAARSADPNSAGSQFFIVYDDAPHLDGSYTVFGEVTSGMTVVDAFPERDPSDPDEPPGPQIARITISEVVRGE